ncbi:interleukin-1 receptor-associated kinase 4 isoform X2 [Leuresthes tenuis]|uniref:interleukin-1 receptor-associated kinase 4 isoform X2 n=1 Tax=Leuresthes tenuis TaxID=355514 RepID=UPI003B50989F
MSTSVTSGTYIRNISYGLRRTLSDFLDPQDYWKDVAVSIRKPSGEPRYSQHHVRRFEGVVAQGKSPTVELLNDWGTTNSTVGELVDILMSHKLQAAAGVLLPELLSAETRQASPETDRAPPTRLMGEGEVEPPPASSSLRTQVLLENSEAGHAGSFSRFLYSELLRITGNFDDRSTSDGGSRLGEGGFGTVYKGLLNNTPVAVKKLNPMQDMPLDKLQAQFHQEIQTLKVLKHENLVDLVGFSCDEQHLCLVYAFMANGSLLDRLACLDRSPPLTWQRRCSIAEGTARGLEYLHCNHHVHRDIKSANILLDENFVAKVSDFGLTRASAKRTSTTVMTERIVGTRAYMAPEALRGEITPKSDVFSFGVVLLEILSGLPPADENQEPQFLMEMRYDIDDEDEELTLEEFVDKKMSDWELSQVESVYCLACNCLHDRKNRRPVIKQVLSEIHSVVKSISVDFKGQA